MKIKARHALCALSVCLAVSVHAQQPAKLDTVRVSVTRDSARSPLSVPFALSVSVPDRLRPGLRKSTLDESLLLVPGLFAANRQNPSQDPRISIRGFGARSAFGVRGVRVLWEGIPLTVADGQTPVDYVDLDAVERIEVIRGTASSLYGNSSGGVISLSSLPADTSGAAVSHWQESGGTRRSTARASSTLRQLAVSGTLDHTSGRGFRNYSRVSATRGSALLAMPRGRNSWKLHLSSLDMPLAENPGAITAAQMGADPRLADPLSIRRKAGKSVRQEQAGISLTRQARTRQATVLIFGGARTLVNPLTFATVHLNRTSGGMSMKLSGLTRVAGVQSIFAAGFDAQLQNDDRHELENCVDSPMPSVSVRCPLAGGSTGAIRRDQREFVTSLGTYLKAELQVSAHTTGSLAVRDDQVRFRVTDRLPVPAAQNQSGSRAMNAVTPMIGVVYRRSPLLSLYVNGSTAFETPTATELANKPDGSTGLNPTLRPQLSRTAEGGIKGILPSGIRYDFAAYSTRVIGELIPFEIPGGAGRRFFRNAGRTRRSGLEAAVAGELRPVEWSLAYTASRFRFSDYTVAGMDYADKVIPGIPSTKLDAMMTIRNARAFLTAEATMAPGVFVDDLNSTRAPSYEIVNLRAGTTLPIGALVLKPAVGVTNLLDQTYSASININAAGGKYYEPGAKRLLYGMLRIQSRF